MIRIALRSLRQHMVSTVITVLSTALGVGLVMAVFALSAQSYQAFAGGQAGFDAVLGARGSQLQLVLNTVFHLETSPGNIPWKLYEEVKADPRVAVAIPYAVGDHYRGYRIVGTTSELFDDFEYQEGQSFEVRPGGRMFDPGFKEAVIGASAAGALGLKEGDHFHPSHGVSDVGHHEHEDEYLVVGVLKPTHSPSDRVIWIPIEGIYRMDGHTLRGTGEGFKAKDGEVVPDEHKEVSAVMIRFKGNSGFPFSQEINRERKDATLAWPIAMVIAELFEKLGWMNRVLTLVAYLVVLVAAGSILASLYNTMNERKREFAILRSLGARRSTVFSVIVVQSTLIAFFGSLVGYGVYAAVLGLAAGVIRQQTGVVLDVMAFQPILITAPLGMILLGALSGLVPAMKAYATDVATNLVSST